MLELPPLWPSQDRGIASVKAAYDGGFNSVVVTSPTGGGKARMIAELVAWGKSRSWTSAIYTNRRIITEQSGKALSDLGIGHGFMAAGYATGWLRDAQVCSFATILARVLREKNQHQWKLPNAKLVLVDEAHSNTGDVASEIIGRHRSQGSFVVGFTATPVGLKGLYEKLIVAGTKRELRGHGALVPCDVFAPDEPDLKGVTRTKIGEYTVQGQVKRLMQTIVVANVFEQWKKLNPDGRPTILFAPGVPESRWFAQQWASYGVKAFHIDANTPPDERRQAFEDSKNGKLPVLCSQGVLREGVDLPWLYHGILCQPCNNISTYLQIVGRLLRAYPGKEKAILQDHAGAYHRHGSPNEDREWRLDDTDESINAERKRAFQEGQIPEPIRCPECGGVRRTGPMCPHCGHKHKLSVRLVRMVDGSLVPVTGRIHKRKKPQPSEDQKVWKGCLYAAAYAKRPMTLHQVAAMFQHRTGRRPPFGLVSMPEAGSLDWNRLATEMYPWLLKRRTAKKPTEAYRSAPAPQPTPKPEAKQGDQKSRLWWFNRHKAKA